MVSVRHTNERKEGRGESSPVLLICDIGRHDLETEATRGDKPDVADPGVPMTRPRVIDS